MLLSPTTSMPSTLRAASIRASSRLRAGSPRASQVIMDRSISPSAASAPSITGTAKRCDMLSAMTKPTVLVRPVIRPRAIGFGVNESSCAAAMTRARVAADTRSLPLIAFEAVVRETPARSATSMSVAGRRLAMSRVSHPRLTGRPGVAIPSPRPPQPGPHRRRSPARTAAAARPRPPCPPVSVR